MVVLRCHPLDPGAPLGGSHVGEVSDECPPDAAAASGRNSEEVVEEDVIRAGVGRRETAVMCEAEDLAVGFGDECRLSPPTPGLSTVR